MRVHDLRHGTATLLLSRGTPMRVIADQLGHANPAITANVYAHVIEAQQRGAIDDLDVALGVRRRSG
jgi:integrase